MKTSSVFSKLYHLSGNFVHILALVFTGMLFLSSFLFTSYALDMTTQEVLTGPDNPITTLLGIGVFVGLTFLICRLVCAHAKKCKPALLILVMGWIAVSGGLLILFGRTAPAADAWSVYSAAESLAQGNTSVIHPTDSYLSYYPQQVGLLAFFELLIRIWNLLHIDLEAYHFIKCLYVLLTCAIVFFQYSSLRLLRADDRTDCIYLILAGTNLPLIMYSSFVYGEIPSFAAVSAGIYFLLKLLKASDPSAEADAKTAGRSAWMRYALISLSSLTLSVMLRKNSLIILIAVVLVVLLEGLHRRDLRLLVFTLVCALLSAGILPATQKVYEYRAGNYLRSGVPAMSYFAMGMQESSRGNGWYNGYNFNTYQDADMDEAAASAVSRQYIAERSAYFKEHPDYALSFYFYKYLSQWADGTYASRQATLATLGQRHPFVQQIYDGSYSPLYIGFCNIYQNILYLGCFCGFFMGSLKRRPRSLSPYVGLIGAFGGFLFHIIWEANARYIFLYGLLLLPYAAEGLTSVYDGLGKAFSNTSAPGKSRKNNADRRPDASKEPPIAG